MRYQRIARSPLPLRILAFFGLLATVWAPWALLIHGLGGWTKQTDVADILILVVLYICFIVTAWFWARGVHGRLHPLRTYGLTFGYRFLRDAAISLTIGFSVVVLLFAIELGLGWASIQPSSKLGAIALEGLAIGLGIGFAEELLFRGWLLAELKTNLSTVQAIVWSGLIFAVAHFIKPLPDIISTSPQFFGLLLLGLILGAARYICCGASGFRSLGLPIGFHGGLVWGYYIVDVADLVPTTGQAPEWITGIHGNPLSGILGLAILSALTSMSWFKLHSK